MKFEGNAAGSWGVEPGHAAERGGVVEPSGFSLESATAPTAKKPLDEVGEKLAAEMKEFNRVAGELFGSLDCGATYEDRVQHVMRTAYDLFGLAPTWTAFYRAILGGEGVLRKAISGGEESAQFECSEEHSKLLAMLTTLRSRDLPENDPFEPQRMITVRIPKSLHDAICEEANALAVSVNKLCISRLLQRVDKGMIPSSSQKRRGRRPGSVTGKPTVCDEELVCGSDARRAESVSEVSARNGLASFGSDSTFE